MKSENLVFMVEKIIYQARTNESLKIKVELLNETNEHLKGYAETMTKKFEHLAQKHNEVKAELKLLNKTNEELENLEFINDSLTDRCRQYEIHMKKHNCYESFNFKEIILESDASIAASLDASKGEQIINPRIQKTPAKMPIMHTNMPATTARSF